MAPILTILVGQYWTRSEHPLRSACWWAGSPIGAFIADAITYGVSDKALAHSKYETWQVKPPFHNQLLVGVPQAHSNNQN